MPLASSASQASLSDAPSRSKRKGCSKRLWDEFSKQETPGHRTIFSLRFAIVIFLAMCAAFLVGGGVLLTYSLAQVQIRVVYSDIRPLDNLTNDERSAILRGEDCGPPASPALASLCLQNVTAVDILRSCDDCERNFTSEVVMKVEQDMDAPIHMYYILHNFYQNHKRYVRSVSYYQLHGDEPAASSLKDCIPERFLNRTRNESFVQNGLVRPCGLIAWSTFNDSFTDFRVMRADENDATSPARLEEVTLDDSQLVWDSDRDHFFGNFTAENLNIIPESRGGRELTVPVAEDEHFMHWMRPAAHPDVRKFYGVIDTDLKKGDRLVFDVTHRFNTYDFDGKKELLFTTAGPFGNRNLTFGIVWLIMGVLNGIITFVYIGLGWHQLWNPERRVEDLQKRWAKASRAAQLRQSNSSAENGQIS